MSRETQGHEITKSDTDLTVWKIKNLPSVSQVRDRPLPHNHSYSCPKPGRTPKIGPSKQTQCSKAPAPGQLGCCSSVFRSLSWAARQILSVICALQRSYPTLRTFYGTPRGGAESRAPCYQLSHWSCRENSRHASSSAQTAFASGGFTAATACLPTPQSSYLGRHCRPWRFYFRSTTWGPRTPQMRLVHWS